MRILRIGIVSAALLATLFVMGCGRSTSPTSVMLTDELSDAGSTAGVAYDAACVMQVADSLAGAPYGLCRWFGLPQRIPRGCPYDEATQSFVCGPTVLGNGLTETHSYQFLDSEGVPQAAYDTLATASMRLASSLVGTTTHGRWMTVDDSRSLVATGMAGAESTRTWNGLGTSMHQDSLVLADSARILVTTNVRTAIQDVVMPVGHDHLPWPLSGSITTRLVASGGDRSVDVTATLTFNGTRYATLVVGDSTCTVDLMHPPHGPRGGPCAHRGDRHP